MDLVVDANVLFSAAIKESSTAELILRDDLRLMAPEYLFEEFVIPGHAGRTNPPEHH
jgi:predicted nucleic acid-binding protein